jgi:peptidoglycan/xylan/chitin deacetylase (PgdA/CDA1 family)
MIKRIIAWSLCLFATVSLSSVNGDFSIETRALWPTLPMSEVGLLILEFHCVSNPPDGATHPELYITVDRFVEMMNEMKSLGLKGVSFSDAIDELSRGEFDLSHVVLTFDDGHDDNLQVARNLLSYGWSASFYIISGKVGKRYPKKSFFYLGWEELGEISDMGFEIGSHTVNHIDLSMASPSRVDYEIKQSVKDIEEKLDVEVRTFSIPKGAYTTDIIIEISRYGLDGCVTSDRGLMTGQCTHKAPRIEVKQDADLTKILTDYLSANLKHGSQLFVEGDEGEKIRCFKTLLVRLGYPLQDSTVFDEDMVVAVADYQRTLGLEPSGELNYTTIDMMVNDFMELVTDED